MFEVERSGLAVLDRALASVFGLAILACDCSARDRRRLASKAVPGVLDVEIRCGKVGRPAVPKKTRELMRRMSRENPTWGAPRIHGELLKLGIPIAESSVSKYLVRWSTDLRGDFVQHRREQ
jgi:hypothetical protein